MVAEAEESAVRVKVTFERAGRCELKSGRVRTEVLVHHLQEGSTPLPSPRTPLNIPSLTGLRGPRKTKHNLLCTQQHFGAILRQD